MASVFDLGLLNVFAPLFVFLLVLVIVYALLKNTKFFPENDFGNALIAFCMATLFILVPELTTIVATATPWFVIFIIFLLFIVLTLMFMGVKPSIIADFFGSGKNQVVVWAIILVVLGIFGVAFTQVYGQVIKDITSPGEDVAEDDLVQSIGEILFTPKVLGLVLLLAVAGFAVRFISQTQAVIR